MRPYCCTLIPRRGAVQRSVLIISQGTLSWALLAHSSSSTAYSQFASASPTLLTFLWFSDNCAWPCYMNKSGSSESSLKKLALLRLFRKQRPSISRPASLVNMASTQTSEPLVLSSRSPHTATVIFVHVNQNLTISLYRWGMTSSAIL